MRIARFAGVLVGVAVVASGWSTGDAIKSPVQLNRTGFQLGIWDVGACLVSGQPSEEAFRQLAKEGYTTVINLRTQPEMDDRSQVPFDERALLKELKMEYVHVPIGDCNPDKVKLFAKALEGARGKVLLHCTVAWRASYMWMAYLVLNKKYTVDEAWKDGSKMYVTGDRTAAMLNAEVSYMSSPKKEGARKPKAGVISKPNSKIKITAPVAVNPPSDDWRAFIMYDLGGILNAGQPDEKKFRELVAGGVKTVVNIRAPIEMEDVKKNGFDEEAVAKELGVKYVNIPITNYQSFTPDALARIAEAFDQAEGKILYHCQSANRTTQTLVPYLIKYQAMTIDEATKVGEAMRWNNMLAEFLGADLTYSLKPKAPAGCGGG